MHSKASVLTSIVSNKIAVSYFFMAW
uniref:Uncharacterized protein n=1 Tax=Rhizophora mucronata TaxID=61149 RepID=A0A2P2QD00_RHIMU